MFEYDTARLHEIAARGLEMARRLGATDASVDISESSGLSVNVRKGSVETIEQTRDKGVGITVYVGKRRGNASTSDFADLALSETVAAAFEIARYTGEDDCAGLPDADQLATDLPELADRYSALSSLKPWLLQWLEGPLTQSMAALRVDASVPLVLMIGRGRLMLRTALNEPELPALQQWLRLFETAMREARRVDNDSNDANSPNAQPSRWSSSALPGPERSK